MHLRKAGRAERGGVDMVEDLVHGPAVFVLKHLQHRAVWHGVGVGAQFGQFVAERLRQDFGAHGQDLSDLDERGAERFEHETHFDGRESVNHVEFVGDLRDLRKTPEFAAAGQMVARGERVFARSEDADGFGRLRVGTGRFASIVRFAGIVRGFVGKLIRQSVCLGGGVRRRVGRGVDDRVDPVGQRDGLHAFGACRVRLVGWVFQRHVTARKRLGNRLESPRCQTNVSPASRGHSKSPSGRSHARQTAIRKTGATRPCLRFRPGLHPWPQGLP